MVQRQSHSKRALMTIRVYEIRYVAMDNSGIAGCGNKIVEERPQFMKTQCQIFAGLLLDLVLVVL